MSLSIFTADQIRKWDEFTIKNEPVSSIDLMERAATQLTKHILSSSVFESVSVFCGVGNNGGDGLVIARLLCERGFDVSVYVVEFSVNPSADFSTNLKRLPKKCKVKKLNSSSLTVDIKSEIIVDAIFGTGLKQPVSGWIGKIIDAINTSLIPVISVDIPSGLFCDDNRGNDFLHVIRATETISFQSPKLCFLFSKYSEFTGYFRIINIGLSENFKGKALAKFITRSDIKLKHRDTFSHKGTNGYFFLVAGFQNYAGAAILSARAALRSGCGYVGVFCSEQTKVNLISAVPEALYISEIHHGLPEKTNAIAIGPGLGTDEHALNILNKILETKLPLVIDADAITLIASHRVLLDKLPKDSILTPHPAELARLIGKTDSPEDFLERQIEFSKKHQVFILQKGAYSKLTTPHGEIFINSSGNPGMGTAGSGDVLTGIIGSLLAQRYSPLDAVITGTFIHGYSADLVKRERGMIGMIASDLVEHLPKAFSAF